jgi:hypothetical protein
VGGRGSSNGAGSGAVAAVAGGSGGVLGGIGGAPEPRVSSAVRATWSVAPTGVGAAAAVVRGWGEGWGGASRRPGVGCRGGEGRRGGSGGGGSAKNVRSGFVVSVNPLRLFWQRAKQAQEWQTRPAARHEQVTALAVGAESAQEAWREQSQQGVAVNRRLEEGGSPSSWSGGLLFCPRSFFR